MWVVADLDDAYIAKMEDVLEVYERPYDTRQPVICLDEKPITLHADLRLARPAVPGREARERVVLRYTERRYRRALHDRHLSGAVERWDHLARQLARVQPEFKRTRLQRSVSLPRDQLRQPAGRLLRAGGLRRRGAPNLDRLARPVEAYGGLPHRLGDGGGLHGGRGVNLRRPLRRCGLWRRMQV
jgi:hypothetical protein